MEANSPQEESSVKDKLFDKILDIHQWWNHLAAIDKNDSILMSMSKILLRIVGIVVFLIISPFAILGIIIAFLVAS